jgi:hypothetical protein
MTVSDSTKASLVCWDCGTTLATLACISACTYACDRCATRLGQQHSGPHPWKQIPLSQLDAYIAFEQPRAPHESHVYRSWANAAQGRDDTRSGMALMEAACALPGRETLYHNLRASAAVYAQRSLLGTRTRSDGAGPYSFLTYGQAVRDASALGRGLVKRAQLEPGQMLG